MKFGIVRTISIFSAYLFAISGVALIAGFCYVRIYIIQDPSPGDEIPIKIAKAFDPWRMYSTKMLWSAFFCFLSIPFICALGRVVEHRPVSNNNTSPTGRAGR